MNFARVSTTKILSTLKILKSCLNFSCLNLPIRIHLDGYEKSKKQMCMSNQIIRAGFKPRPSKPHLLKLPNCFC
jgi:hypothetical protein